MNKEFKQDYEFKTGKKYIPILSYLSIFKYHDLKYLYYFRKAREKGILAKWYKYRTRKIGLKYGIEIDTNIKAGSRLKFRTCL